MHYFPDESNEGNKAQANTATGASQAPAPAPVVITPDVDINTLTPAQLQELNQSLLDEINEPEVHRALISEVTPISELRAEYERGSPSFVQQIDWLRRNTYHSLRRTRGDGDCFYRSVAFAYVERVLNAPDLALAVSNSVSVLESTLPILEQVGFQRMVYEDFYEVLKDAIEQCISPQGMNPRKLLQLFQTPELSNSIVVFLRLVTSAQIRSNPEKFAGFLLHPELGDLMEPRQFCETFVEAVGKEADHVQMDALAYSLHLNIKVAYLDGRGGPNGEVTFVSFDYGEDTGTNPIVLLYRPGHYDILLGPDDEIRRNLLA